MGGGGRWVNLLQGVDLGERRPREGGRRGWLRQEAVALRSSEAAARGDGHVEILTGVPRWVMKMKQDPGPRAVPGL